MIIISEANFSFTKSLCGMFLLEFWLSNFRLNFLTNPAAINVRLKKTNRF